MIQDTVKLDWKKLEEYPIDKTHEAVLLYCSFNEAIVQGHLNEDYEWVPAHGDRYDCWMPTHWTNLPNFPSER